MRNNTIQGVHNPIFSLTQVGIYPSTPSDIFHKVVNISNSKMIIKCEKIIRDFSIFTHPSISTNTRFHVNMKCVDQLLLASLTQGVNILNNSKPFPIFSKTD